MSQHHKGRALVLQRTDYGEADRIVRCWVRSIGPVAGMVRGARRMNSKLGGHIELLSHIELSWIRGKGELVTVTSAQTINSFSSLPKDYDKLQLAYEWLKVLRKVGEAGLADTAASEYIFDAATESLAGLDTGISEQFCQLFFCLRIMQGVGQPPELRVDGSGASLEAERQYQFDPAAGVLGNTGSFTFDSDVIKLWRLVIVGQPLADLARISGVVKAAEASAGAAHNFLRYHLDID